MSQMLFIRTDVFKIKQREMAVIAGVTQTTISRWESGQFEPSRDEMQRIRAEALARRLKWKDAWFFIDPPIPANAGPAPAPEMAQAS